MNKNSITFGSIVSWNGIYGKPDFSAQALCDLEPPQATPVAGANIIITNNTFRAETSQTLRMIHVQSSKNVDFSATITSNKFYNGTLLKETALEVYYPTDMTKINIL